MKLLLIVMCLVVLSSCTLNGDNSSARYVKVQQLVIVKAKLLSSDKIQYGAFKITQNNIRESGYVTFDWIYLSDDSTIIDFRKDSLVKGTGVANERIGLRFEQFNLQINYTSDGTFRFETIQTEQAIEYSTQYCITSNSEFLELNGSDLSSCNF